MTDLQVTWQWGGRGEGGGVGDFKKWGDPSNEGDDFEMGGG